MSQSSFFGGKVLAATFLMAVFGWGIGFYGPPIFMYAVIQKTGWSLALCSAAVTVHFLAGTLIVVNLPVLYKRAGLPLTTVLGATILSLGVYGWAISTQPYQLFISATLSGFGWVTMGAAAVNAIIAPWFVSKRPGALAMAYNGASIGGVVFSSAWVYLIGRFGFQQSAIGVGILSTVVIGALSLKVFKIQPVQIGQYPDGAHQDPTKLTQSPSNTAIPLRANRQFVTLALAMSLGLFAQIGLISQLFLLVVDHVTQEIAGLAMGLTTASAIAGRFLSNWLISPSTNRRTVACMSYGCQLAGCLTLMGISAIPALLWIGMILFGMGIGNATSLPPLIAQSEFPRQQIHRVVTLIVATAQGCYAFAPVFFGGIKSLLAGAQGELLILALAGGIQSLAMLALFIGGKGSEQPRKNDAMINGQ
ncbi:MFS transporter [Pseudomonas sp. NA-150]|uniref:MFS transporter n=1 Tax=Pseudomonas sp. NA-150 TaxID=3367525 RepID=UPI0037C874FC